MKRSFKLICLTLVSALFLGVTVHAEALRVMDKKADHNRIVSVVKTLVSKALEKVPVAQKNLPNFEMANWKVYILAEDEVRNDHIDVAANTIVYAGKNLLSESVVIHGDGILFVEKNISCSKVIIEGKGVIIYKNNHMKYFGGDICIDSGLVISRGINHFRVVIKGDGSFYSEQRNDGDVDIRGEGRVYSTGAQKGDIHLGKGSGTSITIRGDLNGNFTSGQNTKLNVEGDIYGDINVTGSLILQGKILVDSNIHVTGDLTAHLSSTVNQTKEDKIISARIGKINISTSSSHQYEFKDGAILEIGGKQTGNISNASGPLSVRVKGDVDGDLSSGGDLALSAENFKGDFSSGKNASLVVVNSIHSYMVKVKGNSRIEAKVFSANARVTGKMGMKVGTLKRGGYSHLLQFTSGKLQVAGENELDIVVAQDLSVVIEGENYGRIQIGGAGSIDLGRNNHGKLIVGGDASIRVVGDQRETISVGGAAKSIHLGRAYKSIYVKGVATEIVIGESIKSAYDEGVIEMSSGSIRVTKSNEFGIKSLSTGPCKLRVGKNNSSFIQAGGSLLLDVAGEQRGKVTVAAAAKIKVKDLYGETNLGGASMILVTGTLQGDLNIAKNKGNSKIQADKILDSHIKVLGACSISAKEISRVNGVDKIIYIESGAILATRNIDADIVSPGEVFIKAKNIYGNVDVGTRKNL